MKNTIRVQDHPLVAVANHNVQTIADYKYFEEKYWDIEEVYADGVTCSCSVSELFDDEDTESILNDLPF